LNQGRKIDKIIIIFDLFRCSIDELLTHQFVKHSKKMSNDPNILADYMAKILGFYKEKESNNSETNIDQIFGKEKMKKKFSYFLFILDDSNNKYNSINLSWEF
jgi:hypothetical protein